MDAVQAATSVVMEGNNTLYLYTYVDIKIYPSIDLPIYLYLINLLYYEIPIR